MSLIVLYEKKFSCGIEDNTYISNTNVENDKYCVSHPMDIKMFRCMTFTQVKITQVHGAHKIVYVHCAPVQLIQSPVGAPRVFIVHYRHINNVCPQQISIYISLLSLRVETRCWAWMIFRPTLTAINISNVQLPYKGYFLLQKQGRRPLRHLKTHQKPNRLIFSTSLCTVCPLLMDNMKLNK